MVPEVLAIVGATATGKSALALSLAEKLGGEIVNADAMQLYQGMDIGTGKPSRSEQQRVRHHQIDVLRITEEASVAVYQRKAREAIAEIKARGSLPILVGGSGLYVKAVLEPLEFPGTDKQVRQALEEELAQVGSTQLHARLAEVDPDAASAIDPQNARRIVRALEVVQLTGNPFGASLRNQRGIYQDLRIGLRVNREELDQRISARVVDMMKRGWLAEVSDLRSEGLADTRTAARALGYQQLLQVLAGQCDLATGVSDTVSATKKFARRQESWFNRDSEIKWLDASSSSGNLSVSWAEGGVNRNLVYQVEALLAG